MNELIDIFGHRRLIVDLLLKQDTISLNLSQLIITIETLKNMQSESIIEVLNMPSNKWMNAAQQTLDMEDASTAKLVNEKLSTLY